MGNVLSRHRLLGHLFARRGQTLLLFALMMLFLVLMVCLTLSTGMKVKEKMEVQAVADAAAFSNATATARTFNEIALMQRGQIGHMVAMASTQSLISWTGFYRSQIEASRRGYQMVSGLYAALAAACCNPYSGCTHMCACAIKAASDSWQTNNDLSDYQDSLDSSFESRDRAAAKQVLLLQGAASKMYSNQQKQLYSNLREGTLKQQKLAAEVVKAASKGSKWSGEWSAPGNAVDTINFRELGVMVPNEMKKHHQGAAMGSRGYSFVTNRSGGGSRLAMALNMNKIPKPDYVTMTDTGNAWWGPSNNDGNSMSGKFSWADDHGSATVFFLRQQSPCPPMVGYGSAKKSYVKSTDKQDSSDEHVWDPGDDNEPATQRHTLGVCDNSKPDNCPGMWPGFLDYEKGRIKSATDLFGQPKSFAVIQRDYQTRGERADPWNLLFRFRFTPSKEVKFSNSGLNMTSEGQSLDISKQTALSTGLAYYHRMDYWRETPNFFNPYWRATLVPATVDAQGEADVGNALKNAGVQWAADAWDELSGVGYKGGP